MKKVFSLILAFFALASYAEEEKTVTFDFTKPSELNPPVRVKKDSAATCVTSKDYVFKNSDVSLSCDVIGSGFMLPWMEYNGDKPQLTLHRNNKMTISCPSVYAITSIQLEGNTFGSLEKLSGTNGTYDASTHLWTYDPNNINNTVQLFNNSNNYTELTSIKVTYSTIHSVITPTCSPVNNTEVSNFSKLSLSFDDKTIASADASNIKLSPAVSGTSISASHSGNTVDIILSPALQYQDTEQEYTLTIPAGAIKTTDDNYNAAVNYKFKLIESKSTLHFAGITPDSTKVATDKSLPTTFTIKMKEFVKGVASGNPVKITDRKGTTTYGYGSLSLKSGSNDEVEVTTDLSAPITADGIYKVHINANVIYGAGYGVSGETYKHNPDTTFLFNIGDIKKPSDAKLAEARAILAYSGLGYPTETAKTTLQNMVTNESGSDTEFDAAIKALKETDDVNKPENAKSYTIANVAKDGTKRYLAYNSTEKKIESTTTASSAYKFVCAGDSFKVTDGDKTYYLTVLSNVNSYTLVKSTSLTEDKSAAAKLTVAHFSHSGITGMTADDAWGKFSISGPLDETNHAASTLNTNDGAVYVYSSSTSTTVTLKYDGDYSSLFEITEVEPAAPEVTVTTTPADGALEETLEKITITFGGTGVETVNKATDCESKVTLKNSAGESIAITAITQDATYPLVYNITFGSLVKDTYTLTVADGAFQQVFNSKNYDVNGFTRTFTVTEGSDFKYDFNNKRVYSNIKDGKAETVKDFYLRAGFIIEYKNGNKVSVPSDPGFTPEQMEANGIKSVTPIEMYADKNQEVAITDHGSRTILGGHLERLNDSGKFTGKLKFVWDEEPTSELLPDGEYEVYVPEATYGDENFNTYLTVGGISKSACHVNTSYIIPLTITSVTGIQDVDADADVKDGKFMENGKIVIYKGGKRYSLSGMLLK